MMVRIEASIERFRLLAHATRTSGDCLSVPTGRLLPLGAWVDVLVPGGHGAQEIRLKAVVSGIQKSQGHNLMALVLLPPSQPANA